MATLRIIAVILFSIMSHTIFAQQRDVLHYSISLFSDTALHDTVRIDMQYAFFDLGQHNTFVRVVPVDKNYVIETFSKKPVDSLGFLVERFQLDTSYSISTRQFVKNLKNDLQRSKSEKSPLVTGWTYSFVIKGKILASLRENKPSYLYQRLRFNSALVLK